MTLFCLSVMVSTVSADLQNILIGTATRRNDQEWTNCMLHEPCEPHDICYNFNYYYMFTFLIYSLYRVCNMYCVELSRTTSVDSINK
jgi:hypothetical protein